MEGILADLIAALGLPHEGISLHLFFDVGGIATVEYCYYPSREALAKAQAVLERFALVAIEVPVVDMLGTPAEEQEA